MTANSWGENTRLRDLWARAERRRRKQRILRVLAVGVCVLLLYGLAWWFAPALLFRQLWEAAR